MVQISLPLDQLPNVDAKEVLEYIHKVSLLKKVIYYMLDWKTRKQVNLEQWIKDNLSIPFQIYEDLADIKDMKTDDKMKAILRYVHTKITYVSDKVTWGVEEKWQTPQETWDLKKGDCEDGALLIYAIAQMFNIPDYQLFITASDVEGGGHCYVVYISDRDALAYPIDWCYWFTRSVAMKTPYVERYEYYGGEEEWFRFNKSGSYVLWTK